MLEFKVPGMVCEGCVDIVAQAIKTNEPNAQINIDLDSKKVSVDTQASAESIKQIITAAGYEVEE